MARVVKVDLLLEAARYLKGARDAARATDALSDSVDDAGKAGERAADATEKLGDELGGLAADARRLDKDIEGTTRGIRELARQIVATSDAAARADLTKKLRIEQRDLRQRLNLRKLMEVEADDAASGFAARFGGRIGPLMASAPIGPGAAAAGAALGLAMTPTLAATLSAAVVGGAAGAGIIGGVALAARDPRVQAAGKQLGTFIMTDLEQRASGFVPVVLDGIDDVRAGWVKMGPDITRIFASSRLVDPLVAGMVSGSRRLVGGIADAVDEADPVVASFGTLLDGVGDAAGDAFSLLAQDADEGASAIEDLTVAVSNFVRLSAGILHAGATVKGWSDQVDVAIDKGRYWLEDNKQALGVFDNWGEKLDLTADGFAVGSKEAEAYRQATLGTATAADFATLKAAGMTDAQIAAADASGTYRATTEDTTNALHRTADGFSDGSQSVEVFTAKLAGLNQMLNEGIGANISAEQANLRLEEAIDRASEAAKRNGDGIDANNPKQRANRDALLGIASAAKTSAEKIFETTRSHELASVATERGRKKFLETAAAMGVEKGEAIALANKLFGIPNVKREVSINTKQTPIDLKTVAGRIAAIKSKSVVISVHNKITTTRSEGRTVGIGDGIGGRRWGGITEHAQWGVLREAHVASPMGPARYAYAEPATGGEAFVPKNGDPRRSLDILDQAAGWYGATVRPAAAPAAMARPAASVGGTTVINRTLQVTVNVPPGVNKAEVGREVVEVIKAYERGNGRGWRTSP